MFWGEFACLIRQGQVASLQPYLRAHLKLVGGGSSSLLCLALLGPADGIWQLVPLFPSF